MYDGKQTVVYDGKSKFIKLTHIKVLEQIWATLASFPSEEPQGLPGLADHLDVKSETKQWFLLLPEIANRGR